MKDSIESLEPWRVIHRPLKVGPFAEDHALLDSVARFSGVRPMLCLAHRAATCGAWASKTVSTWGEVGTLGGCQALLSQKTRREMKSRLPSCRGPDGRHGNSPQTKELRWRPCAGSVLPTRPWELST